MTESTRLLLFSDRKLKAQCKQGLPVHLSSLGVQHGTRGVRCPRQALCHATPGLGCLTTVLCNIYKVGFKKKKKVSMRMSSSHRLKQQSHQQSAESSIRTKAVGATGNWGLGITVMDLGLKFSGLPPILSISPQVPHSPC